MCPQSMEKAVTDMTTFSLMVSVFIRSFIITRFKAFFFTTYY